MVRLILATLVSYLQRNVGFSMKYLRLFSWLHGESTICPNCLLLTDKNSAEVQPIMNSFATIDVYHGSVHMLCMFHALAKKFKELVYPKLPHEPGGNKLNECGEKYGAYNYGF